MLEPQAERIESEPYDDYYDPHDEIDEYIDLDDDYDVEEDFESEDEEIN